MEEKKLVKELMVHLEEYATIGCDATLYEAVQALEAASDKFDAKREKHRAILVLDGGKVVGKLSQFDIIRALEPKYDRIANFDALSHFGLNVDFIRNMVKDQGLFGDSLANHCRTASAIKVEQVMYTPKDDEYVNEDTDLSEAMHQLMMGRHLSLLVTRGKEIVGILRLSDVFNEVCDMIKVCKL